MGQGGPGGVLGQHLAPWGAQAAKGRPWAKVWVTLAQHYSSWLSFRREKGNWGNVHTSEIMEKPNAPLPLGFFCISFHFISMRQNSCECSSFLDAPKILSTDLSFPSRVSSTSLVFT